MLLRITAEAEIWLVMAATVYADGTDDQTNNKLNRSDSNEETNSVFFPCLITPPAAHDVH